MFFVATAPLAGGHVNVSPKGIAGTFTVVDEHTVAYLDITASGAETIAHLREPGNGRITVMFCSFGRSPDVVRLHGTGRVVGVHDEEYAGWVGRFAETRGARAVIVVDVERVSDSCGYGVPLMEPAGSGTCCPSTWSARAPRDCSTTGGSRTARASTGCRPSTTTRRSAESTSMWDGVPT